MKKDITILQRMIDMEFNVIPFGYGLGLVLCGWICGEFFSVIRDLFRKV
ncbi:MAG: hypothetical protein KJ950_01360 [Proteobacteria bacterium]|nr:hypothetical protein [Pseudomonadota bacterium]